MSQCVNNKHKILWAPNQQRIASSNIQQFINHLNNQGNNISNYQDLHRWSLENTQDFWLEVWRFCDVIGFQETPLCIEGASRWGTFQPSRDTIWFPSAQLNYAENLLAQAFQTPDDVAIWFNNERGKNRKTTWQELCDQVSILQQWLSHNGVGKGDVVAGYLPHMPETVIAMLATTSLGAIWTSTSPDFGVESVTERFGQIKPKILFCCNGYQFNGQIFNMEQKNRDIVASLPSISTACQIDYLAGSLPQETTNESFSDWHAIFTTFQSRGIQFQRINFNDPLFVLYSSGTTGKPKCIVHSAGGTLLNHLKEHQLHCDIHTKDRVFYYTTCGWMMWNWHISALASGATIVIFDGSPVYPTCDTLWQFVEQTQMTLFGTSAKYLEALEKSAFRPSENCRLASLKTVCSTGSVLYPQQFDFVYQYIKEDLHLASISGGTDICGCFVIGNPISPIYRGECQGPALGMDIAVYSEEGNEVTGERGELVCKNSFPNQPLGFWSDDGERYHTAYWDKYYNTWHHGDDVKLTERGGIIFYGRSDTTLNPGGVRIGTAEIYQQVNQLIEITDSIVVSRHIGGDEKIVLFVQLEKNVQLNNVLADRIRSTLKQRCSPRHVPSEIYSISEIPKTKSGKLVELAVKQVLHGQEVKNKGAIANPQVLEEIVPYSNTDNKA